MSDAKLHRILDSMGVPREVWIGTDSVADRLQWLKVRKEMLERTSVVLKRDFDEARWRASDYASELNRLITK